MIELYELKQFVVFAKAGTLSKAAEILHLSQPALSRNMKKLEEEMQIELFHRYQNKLELNENGKYVLELAEKLINEAETLVQKAIDFDRKNNTILIETCAPEPLWPLIPVISSLYPQMSLQTVTDIDEVIFNKIDKDEAQLGLTHTKPDENKYYFKEYGTESIFFALPKDHHYARRKSLSLREMNGENMLLMTDIGVWNLVKEMMPDSRFLLQDDQFSFNELVQASSLPSFTSDLAIKYLGKPQKRVIVPIKDKEATITYYLVCKKNKRKDFQNLFLSI